jgi:FkbM family methyltransferase
MRTGSRAVRWALRESIGWWEAVRMQPLARAYPFSLGERAVSNRVVPWAVRSVYRPGVQDVNGVRMLVPRPPEWGGGGEFHLALGTYERPEVRYLRRWLRPGDGFLDVGGHVGYFALLAAACVGPRGRVLAVEPTAGSAAVLRQNVDLNGFRWATVIEAAATDFDGQDALSVSGLDPMFNSLHREDAPAEAVSVAVNARRLDSIMAEGGWFPVAGIKIDAEGAEGEVLRGATQLLDRNPSLFVIFEVSGESGRRLRSTLDAIHLLTSRGYDLYALSAMGRERPVAAADLVSRLRQPRWQDAHFNVVARRAAAASTPERA